MSEIPPTRFAKLGDDRIAYQIVGDGPVDLLWVAGIGDALDARWEYGPYADLLWRLASFSRLIMMDRRGMGASDPVPLEALPRWEEFVDEALAVLHAADSERTVLLACNDATPTALLFAATRPERTRSLVLFNTTVGSAGEASLSEDEWDSILAAFEENWGTEEGAILANPDQSDDPVFIRFQAKNMRMTCSPKEAGVYLRQIQATGIRDVVPSITVPTLVMHRKDTPPYTQIETSQSLASQIPGARFVAVPGKGLYIFEKPYAQIVDHIEAFVTGISPTADSNRALATILFTDIVASTERAVELGDRKWRILLETYLGLTRTIVEEHRGRVIKVDGDGMLATFDGPGRAVRCASALFESIRPLALELRAGLHTGEVEVMGDDVGGIAVHIAARVMAEAGPSELLVSSVIPALVAGSGIEFGDRGEYDLKGVPGTWRLFVVED